MRVHAIFPDGAMVVAPSFVALEDALKEDAWNPSKHQAFRLEMARRAKIWSSTVVDPESKAKQFLQDLERAGLFRLEIEKDDNHKEV